MERSLPIKIIGVGRYVPERVVANEEIEKIAGLPLGTIDQTAAGVKERRWVNVETETASWMGAQAANEALEDAGLKIEDIDLVLNGSGTQEQAIPDGGPLIQRQLGIADSGIACMSVHSTCLSFLVALNVAANFLASGQHKNILVYSSDIGSVGINPKETESFVLIGDVAAAVVVTRPEPGEASQMSNYVFRTFGEGAYYTCIMGGGTRNHPNHPSTTPEDNLFHMQGYKVFRMAHKHGAETLEALRPGLSQSLGDIEMVIPHQASGMAIKSMTMYGWPEEKLAQTIDWLGNCIAASIPATLYDVVKKGRIQRGQEMLIVGTGAGLSIGAALLTY
jgi:3-oxoacyl-[acyl-carrier-protein] synthase III